MSERIFLQAYLRMAVCVLTIAAGAKARIIAIDDDGPADFSTIQAGIDDANDGDIIVVWPGLYIDDINFTGKNIVLRSKDPDDAGTVEQTVIGGDFRLGEHEAVVTFEGTETPDCRLSGFSINGYIRGSDGGPENHTHATISNCILCNNLGECSAVIRLCDGLIERCVLAGNNISAYSFLDAAVDGCHGLIRNCTFANNRTQYAVSVLPGGTSKIENCILYGSGVFIGRGGVADISYTNLRGYALEGEVDIVWCDLNTPECPFDGDSLVLGAGNISGDPCFVRIGSGTDGIVGDYHLKSQAGRWDPGSRGWVEDDLTSPCIDAGNPKSPIGYEGFPNGGIVNMGAYGGGLEASRSYFGGPACEIIVAGDVNGDCHVNFKDFIFIALHWMEDNGV